mmetsp:Transcript_12285/g.23857  ORF Transcript_12285/g.23857 Transcript_12285/m.23857 type:complete len:356 (+) Transcript_12285:91-1158(+)
MKDTLKAKVARVGLELVDKPLGQARVMDNLTQPTHGFAGASAMTAPSALDHGHFHAGGFSGIAWLFQMSSSGCTSHDPELCRAETIHAILLLSFLSVSIIMIICAFVFFREDKEEQITPLCPALVVKDEEINFTMPLGSSEDNNMTVLNLGNGQPICKVLMDWPDPFRPGGQGVVATVRLQNNLDLPLATVVARSVAVVGHGLALCRAGCEIFGFVEPEGPGRYSIRHRTGVHLLTLAGDFASLDIEGINPVGSKVCWFKKVQTGCQGRALQHVDAGLVLCSLLATHVHRQLLANATLNAPFPSVEQAAAPTAAGEDSQGSDSEAEHQPERSRSLTPPLFLENTPHTNSHSSVEA